MDVHLVRALLLAIYKNVYIYRIGLCSAKCPLTCVKRSRTGKGDNLSAGAAVLQYAFQSFCPVGLSHLCVIHWTTFDSLLCLRGAEAVQWKEFE